MANFTLYFVPDRALVLHINENNMANFNSDNLKTIIEKVWEDHTLLRNLETQAAINEVIDSLDRGVLRAAEPDGEGGWRVNDWVKKAVILYFPTRELRQTNAGEMEYNDKMDLKRNYRELGVRIVPPAVARYGAYLARGVVMMPSYVNIGAYVDEGTMIDTWATVGSCAQIGKDVHLSGGVGIGGVLEPVQAAPVVIEDYAFIGSRSIIVEGARIGSAAVIGAGTVITSSTRIIDVSGAEPVEHRGYVPPRSVVIPGTFPKKYPAGEYGVQCALIIGHRKESTDLKTSLNDALREFNIPV